jgi:hypothetical protein
MIGQTTANYAAVGPQVRGLVESYYSGNPAMKPTQFDLTHYYNPAAAAPAWGGILQDATDLLDHRFGKLNKEYAPNPSWRDSWKETVAKQFDYSGSSFANKPGTQADLDTPIEKSGARGGLANMPGGSNYASSRTGSLSDENANKPGGMGGRSTSNHSSERERDTSVSRSDTSSYGGSSASRGTSTSSSPSNHSVERERDTSASNSRSSSGTSRGNSIGGGARSAGTGSSYSGGRRTE